MSNVNIATQYPYLIDCPEGVISFSTNEPSDFTGYKIYITLPNTTKEVPNVLHLSQLTIDRQLNDQNIFCVKELKTETNLLKRIWNKKKVVIVAEQEKDYIERGNLALACYVGGKLEKIWIHEVTRLYFKNIPDSTYKLDGVLIPNDLVKPYIEGDPLHLSMQKVHSFMIRYCSYSKFTNKILIDPPSIPSSWLFNKLKINDKLSYIPGQRIG